MTPTPSKTLWMGALHMNAQVVTSLFLTSTCALSTSVLTCLQPISFKAPAVPAYGHLKMKRGTISAVDWDFFHNHRHLRLTTITISHTFHTLCPVPQWLHSQAGFWQPEWERCSTCPVVFQLCGKPWWLSPAVAGRCSPYSSLPSHSGSSPHQSPLNENTIDSFST